MLRAGEAMSKLWVVAIQDWFGPTLYLAQDGKFVWEGHDRENARIFTDEERAAHTIHTSEVWMPVSALDTLRKGERVV